MVFSECQDLPDFGFTENLIARKILAFSNYSSVSNRSTGIFIYFAKKLPPVQPYLILFLDFYLVKYQIKIQVTQKLVYLYAYSILYAYLIVKSTHDALSSNRFICLSNPMKVPRNVRVAFLLIETKTRTEKQPNENSI